MEGAKMKLDINQVLKEGLDVLIKYPTIRLAPFPGTTLFLALT